MRKEVEQTYVENLVHELGDEDQENTNMNLHHHTDLESAPKCQQQPSGSKEMKERSATLVPTAMYLKTSSKAQPLNQYNNHF